MTTTENLKALYEAFASGNIPFIIENIAENFTWKDPSNPSLVPFGGVHKGKSGMMEFFQQLGSNTNVTLWEVNDYVSEGNTVVAEGRHGFQSKKTGKNALLEWSMVWKFENGIPVSGRAYYDTAASEKAFSEN